jgi:hypothetical protein
MYVCVIICILAHTKYDNILMYAYKHVIFCVYIYIHTRTHARTHVHTHSIHVVHVSSQLHMYAPKGVKIGCPSSDVRSIIGHYKVWTASISQTMSFIIPVFFVRTEKFWRQPSTFAYVSVKVHTNTSLRMDTART